jgi:sugar lactone lactonase YvrE
MAALTSFERLGDYISIWLWKLRTHATDIAAALPDPAKTEFREPHMTARSNNDNVVAADNCPREFGPRSCLSLTVAASLLFGSAACGKPVEHAPAAENSPAAQKSRPPTGAVDGIGTAARFSDPHGIAIDKSDNLYVADAGSHTIRKITPEGVVTTVAGAAGQKGYVDGTGTQARFNFPWGIAIDGNGALYVTDSANHRIRKITPEGIVSTLAGSGEPEPGLTVDGVGAAAWFSLPTGIAVDAVGALYVADMDLGRYRNYGAIRKISPEGVVGTLAGGYEPFGGRNEEQPDETDDGVGANAKFAMPADIAVAVSGTVYVMDSGNQTIRKVTPSGVVTTLAGRKNSSGQTDGVGQEARFADLRGIAIDGTGNLFVVEALRSFEVTRRISPTGLVSTVAVFPPFSPMGVVLDPSGNLYVSDSTHNNIRKITPSGAISTFAGAKEAEPAHVDK